MGFTSYGYGEEFNVRVDFQVPAKVGPAKLSAKFDLLVCEEQCIPQLLLPSATVEVVERPNPQTFLIPNVFPEWSPDVSARASTSGEQVQIEISGLSVSDDELSRLQLFVESPNIADYEEIPQFRRVGNVVVAEVRKSAYQSGPLGRFRVLLVAPPGVTLHKSFSALTLNVAQKA
jgi:hypothetical protein